MQVSRCQLPATYVAAKFVCCTYINRDDCTVASSFNIALFHMYAFPLASGKTHNLKQYGLRSMPKSHVIEPWTKR